MPNLVFVFVVQVAFVASATAQPVGPRHRLEASVGGLWITGAEMGTEVAELRANRVPPAPFALFTTETRQAATAGFDVRIGYWLTRVIAVEGGFAYMRPELQTRISGDAEGAAPLNVGDDIDQYFIDASVVWLFERFRFMGQTVPFVSGGGGYLRQLHEGQTLVETGQVYNVGGGLRHWLRTSSTGWMRGLGVRFDGRVYILVDGVQFENRRKTHGALSGMLFITF